jgi:hypothetical protein
MPSRFHSDCFHSDCFHSDCFHSDCFHSDLPNSLTAASFQLRLKRDSRVRMWVRHLESQSCPSQLRLRLYSRNA